MDNISRKPRARGGLDVLIIGAGPAGLSASLAAKERGLRYMTLEQENALGGSILHYPRAKIAMTAPMQLPLIGRVNWQEISKEALLSFWNGVVEKSALDIRFGERMETFLDPSDVSAGALLDMAAVMMNLDLIVTVDTMAAHLAGALGRPVWVALEQAPDWRWLLDRADSPWYPTARLFRQTKPGDWAPVIEWMAGALQDHLGIIGQRPQ